jgi:hypothetical protein
MSHALSYVLRGRRSAGQPSPLAGDRVTHAPAMEVCIDAETGCMGEVGKISGEFFFNS